MSKNDKRGDQKEKCPRCGSTIYAKATDKSGKFYCQAKGCQHVWVPGAEAMKRPDVMIQVLQKEKMALVDELTRVRASEAKLKAENAELKAKLYPMEEKPPEAGDEIFT